MTAEDNDRWLEALSGRSEPTDAATRQAARVHQLVHARNQTEPGGPAAEELLARLMKVNADRAAEAEAAAAARRRTGRARPGLLAQAAAWLFPEGHVLSWRSTGAALAMAGLAVIVATTQRAPDDEPTEMKSPPAASGVPGGLAASAVQVTVVDAEPLKRATALKAELRTLGVVAEVLPLGNSARLDANVGADQQLAVQQLLAARGIAWGGGATLSLQIKAVP